MSLDENKEIVRRFFHGAWDRGDFDLIDQLVPQGATDHSTVGGKEAGTGSESFKQIVSMFRSGMPDIKVTIEHEIAEGDLVVHHWSLYGTHQAPILGVPPTGKRMVLTGMSVVRLSDNKIIERWAAIDELGFMRQLGIVPAPASAPVPARA